MSGREAVHTATPWEAEPNGGRGGWIRGRSGEWSALACGDDNTTAQANASFIVRAVNSHDALVEALKLAQAVLAALISPDAIKTTTVVNAWAQCIEAEAAARAALSQSGEG